jgi:hypothetical protein
VGANVILFLSTGRCGTQWFAEKLKVFYGDIAEVSHEPFHTEYLLRKNVIAYRAMQPLMVSDQVARHFDRIDAIIASKPYFETGWPLFGILPLFLDRFKGRVKVVHLYRNPLRVAASHATHRFYQHNQWSEEMGIFPWDKGVVQSGISEARWGKLSELDKNLFRVLEMNEIALRYRENFQQTSWMNVSFEELFQGRTSDALEQLLGFVGLPVRKEFLNSRRQKRDAYSVFAQISAASEIAETELFAIQMQRLGYEDKCLDSNDLRRYAGTPFRRWIWARRESFNARLWWCKVVWNGSRPRKLILNIRHRLWRE